jgi:type I restriction enzyme S subunit
MIPEGWEQVTGAEVTSKITKGASPKWQGFDYQDDGVLFVTSENVRDGYLDLSKEKYLSNEFGIKMANSKLINGDILINIVGASIGRSCQFLFDELEARTNQAVAIFRPNEMAESGYLSYYFQAPETVDRLLKAQSSTARSNLSLGDLRGFQIDLPPLPEQRKIAEILSTWDRAIEVTEALLATARTQKRALMQSLLTGKRRFPEFAGQEWREVRLGEIAHEVSIRNKDSADLVVISCTKSIGFVNSLDYFNKQVFSDDLTGYKIITRDQIGYPSNHIEEGSIGIQNLHDAALVSPIYTIFETDGKVDPLFLLRILKTDYYRQVFSAATSASVDRRGSLRWKAFSTIKVPVPSMNEQRKINLVFDTVEQEIQQMSAQVAKLRTEKKALMQQILTGKRRVAV